MIIITTNYSSVGNPEMTDNFIIKPQHVIKVFDITHHVIGIGFVSSYDKYEYEITLEESSKDILATDILEMLKTDKDTTISGSVRVR